MNNPQAVVVLRALVAEGGGSTQRLRDQGRRAALRSDSEHHGHTDLVSQALGHIDQPSYRTRATAIGEQAASVDKRMVGHIELWVKAILDVGYPFHCLKRPKAVPLPHPL